ncbi:MAG: glucosaminidase domain-containing protein [Labilithrix sp.]|nr:glucosaminidase domain-containing protein [Labilithrix sp.]MCW5835082.1 glucosaminidase domain-containing protein [Labilithrix sp.]
MRVGAGAASAAGIERGRRIEVEPQRTSVTRADLRGAIGRAHQRLTGRAPSAEMLDVLTAHASLETGSGAKMYNYNFGGIKGAGPNGETARCRTKEVIDGREVEIRDGFRAYRSLDEGALDYVRLMRDRFGGAVARAEAGDVDGFARALKQARYYTADESKYASALRGLAGVPDGAPGPAVHAGPAASSAAAVFPDSFELGRVLDAIARHPRVVEEADPDDG